MLHFPLPRLSFFLTLSGTRGRNHQISPWTILSGVNGSTVTHFFLVMARPMSWSDKICCCSYLQLFVVPLLLPFVTIDFCFGLKPSCLIKIFGTQVPLKNVCSLVTLVVSSLVFAAPDTAFINSHIFLEWAELSIFRVAAIIRLSMLLT